MREIDPTVLGTMDEDLPSAAIEKAEPSAKALPTSENENPVVEQPCQHVIKKSLWLARCYWQFCLMSSLWITVLSLQIMVYIGSGPSCKLFLGRASRLERWAWLSPNYLLAPWSAVILVCIFLHRSDRYVHTMFHHRWTLRFSFSNLVAASFASLPVLLRDCSPFEESPCYRQWICDLIHVLAFICGDAIWLSTYLISEVVLFALLYWKLCALEQHKAACWFRRWLFLMLATWLLMNLPTMFWTDYNDSGYRRVFTVSLVVEFIISMVIVTSAIWMSANSAEAIAKKAASERVQADLLQAVRWTRFTAGATCGSMLCSILMQAALLIWMYQGFRSNYMRVVADWLEACDFIMNGTCAAFLSGMIGPQATLQLVEGAFEQVGTALLEQKEES